MSGRGSSRDGFSRRSLGGALSSLNLDVEGLSDDFCERDNLLREKIKYLMRVNLLTFLSLFEGDLDEDVVFVMTILSAIIGFSFFFDLEVDGMSNIAKASANPTPSVPSYPSCLTSFAFFFELSLSLFLCLLLLLLLGRSRWVSVSFLGFLCVFSSFKLSLDSVDLLVSSHFRFKDSPFLWLEELWFLWWWWELLCWWCEEEDDFDSVWVFVFSLLLLLEWWVCFVWLWLFLVADGDGELLLRRLLDLLSFFSTSSELFPPPLLVAGDLKPAASSVPDETSDARECERTKKFQHETNVHI